ncbi:MAG: carboxypeptidase regulatory-like domain-containing protein [Acidobacteria bacterium]|nr:carboxypeptidase regulatory-like domain-containing protein [Acidobacteriota bacterium]
MVHLCFSTDEAGEFATYLPSSGEYAFYATPQFRLDKSGAVLWTESSCEDKETLAPAWSSESTATNMKWTSGPTTEVEPLIVVTCRYVPAWRLEGRVTSSSGVALWNYEVAVEPIEGLDPSVGEMVVHVDGDGRWSVCGLPDGRYRVTAVPDEKTRWDRRPRSLKAEIVVGEVEICGADASIVLQVPATGTGSAPREK